MTSKILQRIHEIDLYPAMKPFLFHFDPEKAHGIVVAALKKGMGPKIGAEDDPMLRVKLCGLDFPNPVGLAAGFDKQAEVMTEILDIGFGFTEVGTITPQPQPGNPKPRLFRIPEAEAAINRFGFNSDGMEICVRRIAAWRDTGKKQGILGVNIGKNKETADAAVDYVRGIAAFAPHADYLTVNVSSPNTPGLRTLQGREELANLLKQVMEARNGASRKPPVFVKIAPDQTEQQEEDIAEVALSSGIDGIIIGNTTVERPSNIPPDVAKEAGGLSGRPLTAVSTLLIGRMYRRTQGKIPIIGVGGIFDGLDAYAKIRAGASLVQVYTALIYKGPWLAHRIKRDLVRYLKRDGFGSIMAAVGTEGRP